ncbi:hypothetical protein JNUCC1_00289 [Lentibacillus sp. JNUCC-1]|uniref:hypothetical protein n=1 Tax=Lentibacillus sp. JNUCC-1 TaxID=2654513 RepID=UPI0012E8FFA2|nr:hypothetical protein [Lentibacillus sp. JNUCC-1]MUV36487.1 hypothetical protein [Lentibacillus sp. JNUCC-1]
MSNQKLTERIQQAHAQIKDTETMIGDAQGSDTSVYDQAIDELNKAEASLKSIQSSAGKSATENPQFQQAYEQLHNLRGDIQELNENNLGPL